MQRRSFLLAPSSLLAVQRGGNGTVSAAEPAVPTTEFVHAPALFCPHCLDYLYYCIKQNLSDDGETLLSREYIYEHFPHPGCPNSGKKYAAALPKVQLQEITDASR